MRTHYWIRHLYLDADGLTLEGDEEGSRFMVHVPPSVIRRFFVLLLRAMRR